jgi:hypothetical protein
MIRFLFKQPQPKRFSFRPRIYDESREFLEARKAVIEQEIRDDQSGRQADPFRNQLNNAWQTKNRRKSIIESNRTVIYITLLLFFVAYLIFFK